MTAQNNDYILLKWETLKAWCLTSNEKAFDIFKQYAKLGMNQSVQKMKPLTTS
jgi:hypothetical protein